MRDIVFNPAAADAARQAGTQPKPTQHPRVIEESPRRRSVLDPTFEENPLAGLSPEKALEAGRKIQAAREFAVVSPVQNAAMLARTWGTSVLLAQRLLSLESENFLLQADVRTLQNRLAALEAKASNRHVGDDLKTK